MQKGVYYFINGAGVDVFPASDEYHPYFFRTLDLAVDAWHKAGCPTQRYSSVWVSELDKDGETIGTVTIWGKPDE